MKYLFINAVCGIGSTGRICTDTAKALISEGHEVKIAYGRKSVPEQYNNLAVRIGTDADAFFHAGMAKIFDNRGSYSRLATKRFLKWADSYDPDVLWLHNLHDFFINIELLFDWIKSRPEMEVRWTQHDCWAFTGGCNHFIMSGCEQWKTACENCPEYKSSSRGYLKNTRKNYNRKKRNFRGVKKMRIIVPSEWLGSLVGQSILKEYPVETVRNGIDRNIFRPVQSNFREKHNLTDKIIVLGAASVWSAKKGLYDFIRLASLLDGRYKIVLVGTDERTEKKLPAEILSVGRTHNPAELAEIYSAADVFLNLTYEDNYPTVNLEAQACGTPVITYRTGGSPESVPPENVVGCGNLEEVIEKLADPGNLKITTEWDRKK